MASSIAALRAFGESGFHAGSKAFQSLDLDALRHLVRQRRLPISVAEAQPGFGDTPMMKSPMVFWVAFAGVAARQIIEAIRRRRKHVYVARRWAIVAFLLRCLPRPG